MIHQSNPSPRALSLFLGMGLFILLVSCSSVHKLTAKKTDKENTVDKSVITETIKNQTITTERADTTIATKADTAQLKIYLPEDTTFDSAAIDQHIQSGNIEITLHTKPVIKNGKKTGTTITATAIKRADSVQVKIEKTTISNTDAQTQTKNDIVEKKQTTQVNKEVTKKRPALASFVITWGILLLIILLVYRYRKKLFL